MNIDNGNRLNYKEVLDFYKNKRVLITGNSGFKGSWLTHILLNAGAVVTGYSLQAPTEPNLYTIIGLQHRSGLTQITADVGDLICVKDAFNLSFPEIVFHLAAQPIVRDSFKNPVSTYAANVMGTVNTCEAVRTTVDREGRPAVRSFLNVTTDKVYKNMEWEYGYRECDVLDGLDPYSNSKSCSELVTHSYKDSFFKEKDIRVSTVRAGNVIGGGDFSNDRIIPDCIRALTHAKTQSIDTAEIIVRNPYSIRPYEHVLEALFAYMLIAKRQYEDKKYAGSYNIGPDDMDCITTGQLAALFTSMWNETCSDPICTWMNKADEYAPHEADFLKLDCSKLKAAFNWKPTWHIEDAVRRVIDWTMIWMNQGRSEEMVRAEMDREIDDFLR